MRSNGFRTQDNRGERNTRRRDEGAGRRDRTARTESHDAIAIKYLIELGADSKKPGIMRVTRAPYDPGS